LKHAFSKSHWGLGAILGALLTLLLSLPVLGSTAGLPGQVAPFVVMDERDVQAALALAKVGRGDRLIDLGSGDGRIVIAAARRGAEALGIELDPSLVMKARSAAKEAGVEKRASFLEGDLFAQDLSSATVVTLYLFPDANLALRPKLLRELAPGTRIVSNSFDLGAWAPDQHIRAASSGGLLLWIVPAQLGGRWCTASGERFRIEQTYQAVRLEEAPAALGLSGPWEGRIRGLELFSEGPQGTLSGRLEGDQVILQASGVGSVKATRC
jgi:SAM-dependent methyltransferase